MFLAKVILYKHSVTYTVTLNWCCGMVPEAVGAVFNTPGDGCCGTRNMLSSFAVNKYLRIVASVGFLFELVLYLFTSSTERRVAKIKQTEEEIICDIYRKNEEIKQFFQ